MKRINEISNGQNLNRYHNYIFAVMVSTGLLNAIPILIYQF